MLTRRQAAHVLALMTLAGCAAGARGPSPGPGPARVVQIETAPGVSIYAEIVGSGPNLVLVPGRLFLSEQFRSLARSDRTVVFYDMRNRGASSRVVDGAQITIMHDVADVEALRRHFGAERLSLVGYSYLGLMTALYAARHPQRVERLVQIGPVPRQWNATFPPDQRAGEDSLTAEGREARLAWQQAREAATEQSDQRALCDMQRRASSFWLVGNAQNAARVPSTCQYENEWPANASRHLTHQFGDIQQRTFESSQFTALGMPVLTIHGTLDRNAPYGGGREWARTFPRGRLITVAGGAHQVWLDDNEVVADIDLFLTGRWPSRAEDIHD